MEARKELNQEFAIQKQNIGPVPGNIVERYVRVAEGYAEVENVLAVLSILDRNESFVVHGKFSDCICIDKEKCSGRISLSLIHI